MPPSDLIGRMMEVAEMWARRQYGPTVTATTYSEPRYTDDGNISTVVDLEQQADGETVRHVLCSVMMEPDGRIVCLPHEGSAS
jgi:hypothetical protein